MEITCDIIRDVLPLYAEDLVSEDTKSMVDEHLCKCDPCTKQLGILKKAAQLPIEVETHSLERVGNVIKKQRILTALCVVFTVLSLIWSGVVFMNSPIYLTAEQAIEGVELQEDGALAVDLARGYTGLSGYDIGGDDKVMSATTTRYDWHRLRKDWNNLEEEATLHKQYTYIDCEGRLYTMDFMGAEEHIERLWENGPVEQVLEHEYDLWYMERDGSLSMLIWDGGDGEIETEYTADHVEGSLAKQFTTTMLMIAVCASLFLFFACICRNKKWKEWLFGMGAVLGSIVVAFLIITGCDFVDYMDCRSVMWNNHLVSLSAVLAVTALLWRRLWLMNRRQG